MLKIRWIKVLRELWGNKARTVLVVLSIAVGVFAVGTIANSWVVLLNDLNTAYNATNPASATLSLDAFEDDLVSAIASSRDVAQAEGRRTVVVKLETPDGELINLQLEAVDDFNSMAISQFLPESGVWPPARRELLLERSYAGVLEVPEGTELEVETPNGSTYTLVLAGTTHDLHKPSAGNSEIYFGYVSFDTLQYLGFERTYNQLQIVVAENQMDKDHISSVATRLKEQVIEKNGYTVFTTLIPNPGEAFLTVIIKAVLLVLAVVGAFSLVLSGALVVNTVSAVITRQIKQIGVMKAIGGMRPQITEIYIAAVAIYGLLSLGVAIPLAVLGTRAFTTYFAGTGNFDILTTGIPGAVIAVEIAIGLLVPVLASLIPVTFGTRITVREAISSYGVGRESSGGFFDRLTMRVRNIPGSLALSLRNTFRQKSRLALTLGTLTLAGAIFVAVLSVRSSLFLSFDEALVYYGYDLQVQLGDSYRVSQIEREAARVDDITAVEGWYQVGAARIRGDASESANYVMIGVPPETTFLEPVLVDGRWVRADDRNKIVVNNDFLREEEDIQVGDTITLKIGIEETEWQIVGAVTPQYSTPVIYVGIDDLGRETGQVGYANRALLSLTERDPVIEAQAAEQIEDRFKKAGLLVGSTTTRSDFVETFEMRFNFLVVFLIFLAVMLAFVGALGLAGTMSLNVLERTREIGVMRAVGASDRSVQRIVVAEGLVIGLISWVISSVVAFPLSLFLSTGVGFAFGGEPLSFSFSLVGVGIWLALVLLIAGLSSYIPARRASKLSVREILAYE